MKLLLIRHAVAVPRGTPGIVDDDRPLTARGRRRFRRAARGLARIVAAPDTILTSPLPRARATAEIAARAWRRRDLTLTPELAHGTVDDVLGVLGWRRGRTVAVVGHEPMLSALLARLLGASDAGRLTFRKGGAALVDAGRSPAAGGRLVWYLKPRLLRKLAR